MARFQVPQFLEVEDKIFGPFTLKQFLYGGAGIAIAFIAWQSLPRFAAILVGLPSVALFFGLAFYKINNQPLIFTIENAFKYAFAAKLYLWKKREKTPEKKIAEIVQHVTDDSAPKISNSKLKDLSWGLDIHETLNTLEDVGGKSAPTNTPNVVEQRLHISL